MMTSESGLITLAKRKSYKKKDCREYYFDKAPIGESSSGQFPLERIKFKRYFSFSGLIRRPFYLFAKDRMTKDVIKIPIHDVEFQTSYLQLKRLKRKYRNDLEGIWIEFSGFQRTHTLDQKRKRWKTWWGPGENARISFLNKKDVCPNDSLK